jgi:hypothetical protein
MVMISTCVHVRVVADFLVLPDARDGVLDVLAHSVPGRHADSDHTSRLSGYTLTVPIPPVLVHLVVRYAYVLASAWHLQVGLSTRRMRSAVIRAPPAPYHYLQRLRRQLEAPPLARLRVRPGGPVPPSGAAPTA